MSLTIGKCELKVQSVPSQPLVSAWSIFFLQKRQFRNIIHSHFTHLWRRGGYRIKRLQLWIHSADWEWIELRQSKAFINGHWWMRGNNTFIHLVDVLGWTVHKERNIYRQKGRDGKQLQEMQMVWRWHMTLVQERHLPSSLTSYFRNWASK